MDLGRKCFRASTNVPSFLHASRCLHESKSNMYLQRPGRVPSDSLLAVRPAAWGALQSPFQYDNKSTMPPTPLLRINLSEKSRQMIQAGKYYAYHHDVASAPLSGAVHFAALSLIGALRLRCYTKRQFHVTDK